jgi:hypothetical protein
MKPTSSEVVPMMRIKSMEFALANEALRLSLSPKTALRIYGKLVSLGVQPTLTLPSFIPAHGRDIPLGCPKIL